MPLFATAFSPVHVHGHIGVTIRLHLLVRLRMVLLATVYIGYIGMTMWL